MAQYQKKYDKKPGGKPRNDRRRGERGIPASFDRHGFRQAPHQGIRPLDDRYGRGHAMQDKIPETPALEENTDREEEIGSAYVIGRNAVRELLKSGRSVDKIYVQKGEREGSIVMLVALAEQRGIPILETEKGKMDEMAGFVPHQGVIAMAAEKDYVSVEDILKIAEDRGEKPLLVLCDGISDPYNLGALIRCAEGAGAHGVVIPKRRAAGLTPLVGKSSAGALEYMAVAKVSNLSQTIRMLQERGVWVYAAEAGGQDYAEIDMTVPCAIVMGSEGDGVSELVKKTSDAIVSIPMYGQVNSFNVSTAGAVLLCEAARQRHSKK